MSGYVYIMASKKRGTIYIGVTGNIAQRAYQHREGVVEGFTKRYDLKRLVFIEAFDRIDEAIAREKQLKAWRREWKIELIEETNPDWRDLISDLNS